MSPFHSEHTHTQAPNTTDEEKTDKPVWCSLISRLLARTIMWVSLSLFICILSCFLPRSFFLFSCLPESFGPETKNQPSRALADKKKVKERTSASYILCICRPLEVSSVPQKEKEKVKEEKNAQCAPPRSAVYSRSRSSLLYDWSKEKKSWTSHFASINNIAWWEKRTIEDFRCAAIDDCVSLLFHRIFFLFRSNRNCSYMIWFTTDYLFREPFASINNHVVDPT
jgi:hypothetical protein